MSDVDPGYAAGSDLTAGAGSAIITNLLVELTTQANALVDPSDTPTSSRLRFVKDSTGKTCIYLFDAATSAWTGVELA